MPDRAEQCLAPGGFEGALCRRTKGHSGSHGHRTSWGETWWQAESSAVTNEKVSGK